MIAPNTPTPSPTAPTSFFKSKFFEWTLNTVTFAVGFGIPYSYLHQQTYQNTETWEENGVLHKRIDTHRLTTGRKLKSEVVKYEPEAQFIGRQ